MTDEPTLDLTRLSQADLDVLTPEVTARWTNGLASDEYPAADIVRLERQRRSNLRTLRQGIELTDLEWKFFRFLSREPGKIKSYLEIARHLWGTESNPVTARRLAGHHGYQAPMVAHIQVLVSLIRHKLEIDPLRPQHIANVRGVGYVFYTNPPSLDDGIDYRLRAREALEMRAVLKSEFGLEIDDDEQAALLQHRGRAALGPEHSDYEGRVIAAVNDIEHEEED
jgi:hypothetical protein